jgi:hypothetical protein
MSGLQQSVNGVEQQLQARAQNEAADVAGINLSLVELALRVTNLGG